MNNPKALLFVIGLVLHGLAAIALVFLFLQTRGMTVFCVVAGGLIGGASVLARPGRPISVYVAFGVLMGYAFWAGASAISQGALLELLIVLLVAGGAAWFLQDPRWPAALTTAFVVLLAIGLAVLQFRLRPETLEYDPVLVRHGAITSLVILGLGLVYLGLGFVEASLPTPRKPKRKVRRVVKETAEEDE